MHLSKKIKKANVVDLVLNAVEELNQQLLPHEQVPLSVDAQLFGSGGNLDSLGLVNLIVLVEERATNELGVSITLTNEKKLSQENSPFRSVQTLASHIHALLEEDRKA